MPEILNPYPAGYESIRVYKILPADALAANAARIGRVAFGVASATTEGPKIFSLQAASGFLYYADADALWKNQGGDGLPIAAGETEKIMRLHLDRINVQVAQDAELRKIGLTALFPSELKLIDSVTIPHPESGQTDHLLCRFSVSLPTGLNGSVTVDGAIIEARIGRAGALLALSTRWRPIVAQTISNYMRLAPDDPDAPPPPPSAVFDPPKVAALVPPTAGQITAPAPPAKPDIHDSAQHHHHEDEPEPVLIYNLEDGNTPQRYYTPYYLQRVGHHGSMQVASAHSLIVDMVQQSASDGALTVKAAVTGGSGQHRYEWFTYCIADFDETGLQERGTDDAISLDQGYFNVILRVSDLQTEQVVQIERTVFV